LELELTGVTYQGPAIGEPSLLEKLPKPLAGLLESINGFVAFQGGLHVRGICVEPDWHSLQAAWDGANAFHHLYANIRPDDIPFAQDCVGDQFLLRDEKVIRLSAEDGQTQSLKISLKQFLSAAQEDPVDFLVLEPLIQTPLAPGELIHVYPPYCTAEAANGVSLKPVPAEEVIRFHADLAKQLPPDGEQIEIRVVE